MFALFATILRVLFCGFQSRRQLMLENLALRHQLTVLQRSARRAKLKGADRFLWVLLLLLVRLAAGVGNRSATHCRSLALPTATFRVPFVFA